MKATPTIISGDTTAAAATTTTRINVKCACNVLTHCVYSVCNAEALACLPNIQTHTCESDT